MIGQKAERDYLETLKRELDDLKRRVKLLEEAQRTYVPVYDRTNMPTVAQEGEVCIIPIA